MATKPESKQTNSPAATTTAINVAGLTQTTNTSATAPTEKNTPEKFKAALEVLDAERTALVKTTIENLKPGTPFDHAALRDIQRVETRKNRLIVGRFAALLKKNEPGIVPIVHQILEI